MNHSSVTTQNENEYENVEAAFGGRGPSYVRWAASMAVGLRTGVPWMMCKQSDAPDPVVTRLLINTCNGMNCGKTFLGPNSPKKPALWTENWTQSLPHHMLQQVHQYLTRLQEDGLQYCQGQLHWRSGN
ncbi:hypothetical protein GW17_00035093 [Ensete ventricosum]|nr:hypothetical protein GW17_00035093 [Ensete ventricosum]